MGETYQYDAFISYRHKPLDKAVATKLHKLLETYVAPKKLGLEKRKLSRVFRDQEELPSSSDLASNIQEALQNSAFLIVICSPDTPKSRWVGKEIETFIAMHGEERVLAVLIDGEPQESFPLALTRKKVGDSYIDVEPLAADIRVVSDKERNKKLKQELIRLMAALLGCRYDDLRQRHRERQLRRVIGLSTIIGGAILSFGAVSTWQAILLQKQVNETLAIQSKYLSEDVVEQVEEGNRLLALSIGLELLPENMAKPNRPYVEEAEASLHQALYSYKLNNYLVGGKVLNHESRVKHMTISKDGKYLLSEAEDATLTFWELATGEPIWQKSVGATNTYESGMLIGKSEALIREAKTLKKIDTLTQEVQWKLDFENEALKIMISDDETIAVVYENTLMGEDEKLYEVDLQSGEILTEIFLDEGLLSDIVLSPNKEYVAIGLYDDHPLQLVNLRTKEITRWTLEEGMSTKLAFSKDSKKLACVRNEPIAYSEDDYRGTMTVYDLEGRRMMQREVNQWGYDRVRFSLDKPDLLILVSESYMEIVDVTTGEVQDTYVTGGAIESLIWRDEMLVVGCDDGTVRFFLEGYSTEVERFRIQTQGRIQQLIQEDGRLIMLDTTSSMIKIYEKINDEGDRMIGDTAVEKSIWGRVSESGKLGLIYTLEKEFELWDLESEECIKAFTLTEEEGSVKQVAFYKEQPIIITYKDQILTIHPDTKEQIVYDGGEDIREIVLSEDASKILVETYTDVKVLDSTTLEVIDTLDTIPIIKNRHLNNKGEILFLTEEGASVYIEGQYRLIDENNWEEGIIGEHTTVLWNAHQLKIYQGEKASEMMWPGKVIESICLLSDEEQIILEANDDVLYVIDVATIEQIQKIPLLAEEWSGLIHCRRILKDNSILLEGEDFKIKLSGESYKPIWRSKQVLDVSTMGDAVMVRDKTLDNEGNFRIYPYYSTQETIEKAEAVLTAYWLDGGMREVYNRD